MMETAQKSYNNAPKRSNIGSPKRLPMVPHASSLLLGGACVVTALDEFHAATIISRPQPAIYSMFERPARQASSDQEATSDVHEVSHGQPSKKKRLSSEQVKFLESSFDLESKLEPERKNQLANELGLQPRQVAVWYQNKRARSKTKQLEHKHGVLKLQFQAVVAEKQQLETEVFRLRELLGLQEEKIPEVAEVETSVGKDEAAGVSNKHEEVATLENEQRFSKELQQAIKEEVEEVEEEGEETAVDTEAESVEVSCSGTGLSEALDANSPASNNYDRPQSISELTQIMPPFIDQSNFAVDQMLLFQQEHHVVHQPHHHIWTNYHQLGSVKLEHNDSGYLIPFSLEDDMDSLDFKFVAYG